MNITAISGSLRKDSHNTNLLYALEKLGYEQGVSIKVNTLEEIPFFSEDLERTQIPESLLKLANQIRESDGILISTPEYNGITSGALINTLEWLSRDSLGKPLINKVVGIIGATTGGFGTNTAQTFLKSLAVNLDMLPMNKPKLRVSYADKKFDKNGLLIDMDTKTELVQYITDFKKKILSFK